MSGIEDRGKNLEEEYFHRKNQEDIEKLRAKMKAAAQAAAPSSIECPRCDGSLREIKLDDVTIDMCDECSGVWLDSGELEQLTKKGKAGWFGRLWGAGS